MERATELFKEKLDIAEDYVSGNLTEQDVLRSIVESRTYAIERAAKELDSAARDYAADQAIDRRKEERRA